MSKPYGLTANFQVVVPSSIQNQIWDVVRDAVEEGMSATTFIEEIREAWDIAMDDKKKRDLEVL